MADKNKIVPGNVSGDFFVDTTCINCDNCRALAPTVFGEFGDFAGVKKQPENDEEIHAALRALICCPTGSIGTMEKHDIKAAMSELPIHIDGGIYYSGFNSPKAAGGQSYVMLHDGGNWMTDSPKFHPHVTNWIDEHGGLKYIFLTHRDDVADAKKYAEKYGAKRIIHRADLEAQPDAEIVIDGTEPVQVDDDFLIVPMPGHTEGHCMMLYKNKYLFSGDSLTSNYYRADGLECWGPLWTWYSFDVQTESLEKLRNYDFEWVLPGHGRRWHVDKAQMRKQLENAITWAQHEPPPDWKIKLAHVEAYADYMEKSNQPIYAAKQRKIAEEIKAQLSQTQ